MILKLTSFLEWHKKDTRVTFRILWILAPVNFHEVSSLYISKSPCCAKTLRSQLWLNKAKIITHKITLIFKWFPQCEVESHSNPKAQPTQISISHNREYSPKRIQKIGIQTLILLLRQYDGWSLLLFFFHSSTFFFSLLFWLLQNQEEISRCPSSSTTHNPPFTSLVCTLY